MDFFCSGKITSWLLENEPSINSRLLVIIASLLLENELSNNNREETTDLSLSVMLGSFSSYQLVIFAGH